MGSIIIFLCKPDDDLRKDHRIMEFYNFINSLLTKHLTLYKGLYIITYRINVLSSNCALLEWLYNTQTFRNILIELYTKSKFMNKIEKTKKIYRKFDLRNNLSNEEINRVINLYTNEILPLYPTVFHKFFLKFPDLQTWFNCKNNYIKSTAVTSIVGYLVGLGDRHGENILININNANCIHVDFDCLFDKGKELSTPECVPFRLTHNMLDAFGITSYNGTFKKTCILLLDLLQTKKESLLGVLRPFINDPISRLKCNTNNFNMINLEGHNHTKEIAESKLKDIELKLLGYYHKEKVPVSTYVMKLIEEATSIRNLSLMYIGWGSYL